MSKLEILWLAETSVFSAVGFVYLCVLGYRFDKHLREHKEMGS